MQKTVTASPALVAKANNKRGLAMLAAGASSLVWSATAGAFEIGTILSGSDASDNSDAIAIFVLGVVIILFTLGMARKGLGK